MRDYDTGPGSAPVKLHITGASGSGTSTLAAALAAEGGFAVVEADDHYWLPTDPPYQAKRDPVARAARVCQALNDRSRVVLAGSVVGWGAAIEEAFDLIVFLYLPASLRVQRLREREQARLGQVDTAFLTWAAQYDEGPPVGRSLAKHQAWLAARRCPVLRLEGDMTVAARVAAVQDALRALPPQPGPGERLP